jgi:hypothetical protein
MYEVLCAEYTSAAAPRWIVVAVPSTYTSSMKFSCEANSHTTKSWL